MSRATGDVNLKHYHVVKGGHVESRSIQRWDLAWAAITKRARLDHDAAWRVVACPPSGCRLHVIR